MSHELNSRVLPIKDLLKLKFFIPSYQRGYRWEKEQVYDLLYDINEFTNKEKINKDEFYCLQPLVVKLREDGCYEVLDGQQRLTTVLLILNNISAREQKVEEYTLEYPLKDSLYQIDYETRIDSRSFLNKDVDSMASDSRKSIDHHFMYEAAKVIHDWFKDPLLTFKKRSDFNDAFLNHTKFIWHEVRKEDDVIDTFTRLNRGKIPLTNAELIKALFLNSSNFSHHIKDVRLIQIEIASEWDRIEYSLQDEEFWAFLGVRADYNEGNRIEHILDLFAKSNKQILGESNSFRFYQRILQNKEVKVSEKADHVKSIWTDFKHYFQTLRDWFYDKTYFHCIGFLLSMKVDIHEIFQQWCTERRCFKSWLKGKILEKIGGRDEVMNIDDLEYGKNRVKDILLLHNILIMLQNKNDSARFSFTAYYNEKWDVEHIHACGDDILRNKNSCKEWLDYNADYIEDEKIIKLKENFDIEEFSQLYQTVVQPLGESINSLSNLCLLDAGTNRAYKNAVYSNKRSQIIKRFSQGQFIPLATLNVFNKFYSANVSNMEIWDEAASLDYLNNIKNTIANFLDQE